MCETVKGDKELLGFGDVPYSNNQVMRLVADISKLTKDTGFVPKYSFKEGINKTAAWIKATYRKEDL